MKIEIAKERQKEREREDIKTERTTHGTTMIDEACQVTDHSSINDRLVIHSEQVAGSDPRLLVLLLSQVRHGLPDHRTHILDHHLVRCDWL